MISTNIEQYLKVIYKLDEAGGPVTTSAIATRMHFSVPSVTNMVKRLAEMKLVRHAPYRSVALTPAGRKIALAVIRHHRLLELYLADALGYSWDQVHAEAEGLEHHISEELENKIAQSLGNPTHDPHGDPIPTPDGTVEEPVRESLANFPASGESGVIRRVNDDSAERLRYLSELGVRLNQTFTVVERAPFKGPIRLRMGEKELSVGAELAHEIFVTALEASNEG